jgi:RNA polymerase sigma factor (sigma-70 family)
MRAKPCVSVGVLGPRPSTSDHHAPPSEVVMTPLEQKRDGDDLEGLRERVIAEFTSLEPWLRSMIDKRIARRLKGKVDVELVIQEALDRLLKSVERRRPGSESEMRAWIFKKVWSRWYDELRRWRTAGRDAEHEEDLPSGSDVALVRGVGVVTDFCLKERVDQIRNILGPVDFTIVELRIVDDMPFGELAGLVGLKENTVCRRFARALLKIKKDIPSPFNSSW